MAAHQSPGTQEAMRLLGGFVRYVRERDEALASRLVGLVLQWAAREGISMSVLMGAISSGEQKDG
jgi:hypothetical protein